MKERRFPFLTYFMMIILGIIFEFFLYLLAAARGAQDKFNLLLMPEFLKEKMKSPFENYINEYTFPVLAFGLLIYLLFCLYVLTKRHNLMRGNEYGNAKFANPKKISKLLSDSSKSPSDPKNIVVKV